MMGFISLVIPHLLSNNLICIEINCDDCQQVPLTLKLMMSMNLLVSPLLPISFHGNYLCVMFA